MYIGSRGKSGKLRALPGAARSLLFFSGLTSLVVFLCRRLSGVTEKYGRVFMVHKRSKDKLLQRQIRRIIYLRSYDDRITCETVSQVSREDVLSRAALTIASEIVFPKSLLGRVSFSHLLLELTMFLQIHCLFGRDFRTLL